MERRLFFFGIGLACGLVFSAVMVYGTFVRPGGEVPEKEILYQVSTIDALIQGAYDEVQPVSEVKKHGDFGIGTFDGLDGEMIVLGGTVYHAKTYGAVNLAPESVMTPFASVTYFERDFIRSTDKAQNYSEFSASQSSMLPPRNIVYAVFIHGTFPAMKVRAIPRQHKPYPPLADASVNRSVYNYPGTTGTVVGFYTPVFFKSLNVPGYHLHYISDDHMTGGNVLDMTVPAGAVVEYDKAPQFTMVLPEKGDFIGTDLSGDLKARLERIER